jgi:hypothetical protein
MNSSVTSSLPLPRTGDPELQLYEDMCWALEDESLRAAYLGEYVVPYRRTIVAHGTDPQKVRAEAASRTGEDASRLPLVPIDNLLPELSPFSLEVIST